MFRLACLLVVFLLAAGPAQAATALEQARLGSSSARQKVNDIRARQMALRAELNQVAGRIEALKTQQKRGADLDAALRQSQALSGSLAEAAQELSRALADAEREHLSLLSALTAELDRAREQVENTQSREARAGLLARMRALRQEREQVRALLPAAKVPALEARGSDDPEDLLEQADMLRDSEDKLRQKMRALETRVAELRQERELDRRMSDFLGDEAMFDDHDRRLRRTSQRELTRGTHPPLSAGQSESADFSAAPPGDSAASAPAAPGESRADPGQTGVTSQGNITYVARGADSRPHVGGMDARMLEGATTRDIESLEAELAKLKKLARDLNERAQRLENRARE
jgi:hypothetical protein